MNIYSLPRNNNINTMNVNLRFLDKSDNGSNLKIINKSLFYYLFKIKKELDHVKDWDMFKKLTYNYEYINTRVDSSTRSVCSHEPISRAYFKLYEILVSFNLITTKQNIKCFHLAEGPGGFIEATVNYRKNILKRFNTSNKDTYIGMTLINNNKHTPKWDKCQRLLKQRNIVIEYGADKTGDLFNFENLNYCIQKYGNSMDFITADGGFDFSNDFNRQEVVSVNLIFAQVVYALFMQKNGGTFVVKVFDTFRENTINIIVLLNYVYNNVNIIKPDTSRTANSEKYIVCRGYKNNLNSNDKLNILSNFYKLKTNIIHQCVTEFPSYYFLTKMEEINSILGQQQLENINQTLNIIFSVPSRLYTDYEKRNREKINNAKKNNITKCIKWCRKFNLPINSYFTNNILYSTC